MLNRKTLARVPFYLDYQDQFEFPATGAGQIDIEVGSIDEISQEFARAVVASILEGF